MLEDDSERNQDLVASLQELVDIKKYLKHTITIAKQTITSAEQVIVKEEPNKTQVFLNLLFESFATERQVHRGLYNKILGVSSNIQRI